LLKLSEQLKQQFTMNKTIAAALTILALATGTTFAQRGYDNRNNAPRDYRYDDPRYRGRYDGPNSRYERDEIQEEIKIDRLDALVGLTNRQERQLHRIEDQYDRVMNNPRLNRSEYRQLQLRKRQDMLAVLTSAQRDRLFDAQQQRYGNRRGNGYGYGRRG
jgi:hypothetical protein